MAAAPDELTGRRSRRLDEFQRDHPALGFPIGVIYKFTEDQGPYLAALITYYGFLSLFPLLLLLASILGFVLQGDSSLQTEILDSTLSQFPVIREQLGTPQSLRGSVGALVAGALVAIYGALGVAQALQNAMNVTWSVPRNRRPNPLKARLRSLTLIGIGGLSVLATTVLSALIGSASAFGASLGRYATIAAIVISLVMNGGVFLLAFRVCTRSLTSWRNIVPGAVFAASVWQLLELFGTAYVGHFVKGAGATYGVFAVVLGLLGWIFLAGIGVVLGAEINVVRTKRLYPRSLMTPFTDNVDLTDADRRAYVDAVRAQQFKGFEHVTVTFDDDGQHATAVRRRRRDRRVRDAVSVAAGGPDISDDPSTDEIGTGRSDPTRSV